MTVTGNKEYQREREGEGEKGRRGER